MPRLRNAVRLARDRYPYVPTAAPVCEPTSQAMFDILNLLSNPTCERSRCGNLSGPARDLAQR